MYNRAVMFVLHLAVTAALCAGAAVAIMEGYVEGSILVLFALKTAGDAISVCRG